MRNREQYRAVGYFESSGGASIDVMSEWVPHEDMAREAAERMDVYDYEIQRVIRTRPGGDS